MTSQYRSSDNVTWTGYDLTDMNNTCHVVPSDGEHEIRDCWCEPETQDVDGSVLVIHRCKQ